MINLLIALALITALLEVIGVFDALVATAYFWNGYLRIREEMPRTSWEGTVFSAPPHIAMKGLRRWHSSSIRRWLGGQDVTITVLHTNDGYAIEWPTRFVNRAHAFWWVYSFGVRKSLNYINWRARARMHGSLPVSSVTIGSKFAPPRYTIVLRTGAKAAINVTAPEMEMKQWETTHATS